MGLHAEILALRDKLGITYKDASHRLYMTAFEKVRTVLPKPSTHWPNELGPASRMFRTSWPSWQLDQLAQMATLARVVLALANDRDV